ncbi:MAG: tetratricopeptide repeat-containing sulfotransferase family protein [Pseudomonadota bacterium]
MQQPESLSSHEIINRLRIKVARNPGDLDAGLMLGSALYKAGHYADSGAAFRSLLLHHPDHPRILLLLARSLARSGQSVDALQVLNRARQVSPDNPQVWQIAAALASDIRDWSELLRIARDWTTRHPGSLEAWQALSRAHFEESRFSEAITAYDRVLKLEPGNPSCLIGAARLAIAAHQYEQARHHLQTAQEISPDSAELLYTLARLHHLTGELETAEDFCRRAIAARPGFATAYVELGALCEGRLDDAEIVAISQLFNDQTVHPEYRVMLGFTLGDALDRRNECDQAFAAWDRGNEINRSLSEQEGFVYQPELIESELALLPGVFEDLEIELHGRDSGYPRPVFVLGMPRSGTTLIESILASHSTVHGAGELPTLYDIHEELMEVARGQGVEAAREMVRSEAAGWRERYLAAMPSVEGRTRVVDKQPLNFRSIGLIRLLFPESPILYTRRQPMDVGFSIYRHKFSKNWPCAHRLADIGHYHGIHDRIVAYWQAHHGGSIHVVDHASLVADPESTIRELLAFAELPFETACLSPHKTRRPVATFSAVQVQQPVSAEYTNRAARYKTRLVPLREALRKAGTDVPDDGPR